MQRDCDEQSSTTWKWPPLAAASTQDASWGRQSWSSRMSTSRCPFLAASRPLCLQDLLGSLSYSHDTYTIAQLTNIYATDCSTPVWQQMSLWHEYGLTQPAPYHNSSRHSTDLPSCSEFLRSFHPSVVSYMAQQVIFCSICIIEEMKSGLRATVYKEDLPSWDIPCL